MPLKRCSNSGKSGWKWGDSGHCYTGPGAKKKAIKQGIAIEGPDKFKSKASSGYGFCPLCGDEGKSRERRLNGNDMCTNGHIYPSRDAVHINEQEILEAMNDIDPKLKYFVGVNEFLTKGKANG